MDTQPDRETQGKENHRRDAVSPDIDMQSGDEKPDVFSKTARLGQAYSEATGHPAPPHSIIMGNEAEFQRTIDTIRRAKLLKEHPRLAAWLAENRTNGEIAERDLENLARFDRIAKDATEREKDRRNSVFYQPAAASKTDADVGRKVNPAVSVTPPGPAPSDSITPMATAPKTVGEAESAPKQPAVPLGQMRPASSALAAPTAATNTHSAQSGTSRQVGTTVKPTNQGAPPLALTPGEILILKIADVPSLSKAARHQLLKDIRAQKDINPRVAERVMFQRLANITREQAIARLESIVTSPNDVQKLGQSIIETGKGIPRGTVRGLGSTLELAGATLEPEDPAQLIALVHKIARANTMTDAELLELDYEISQQNLISPGFAADNIAEVRAGRMTPNDVILLFTPQYISLQKKASGFLTQTGIDVQDYSKTLLPSPKRLRRKFWYQIGGKYRSRSASRFGWPHQSFSRRGSRRRSISRPK